MVGDCSNETTSSGGSSATTSSATTSTATTSTATTSTATTSTATTSTATTSTATTSPATTSTATTSTATTSTATTSTATTSTATTSSAGYSGGTGTETSSTGDGAFQINSLLFENGSALRNYNTNYYGGSSAAVLPKGGVRNVDTGEFSANPFIHPLGNSFPTTVNYDFTFQPAENRSANYKLGSNSTVFTYLSPYYTARGNSLSVILDDFLHVQKAIGVFTPYSATWRCTADQDYLDVMPGLASPPGKMYVTLHNPITTVTSAKPTIKRMSLVCDKAKDAINAEGVADEIWDYLQAEVNFLGTAINDWGADPNIVWKLLDEPNRNGDCDDWAFLMRQCVGLLGVTADVNFICASTDTGDVLDMEEKIVTVSGVDKIAYLTMKFPPDPDNPNASPWNRYEGVCKVSSDGFEGWWLVPV